MYAVATCTVSILRGTATDPVYGDPSATPTVVASGVPASITERRPPRVTTPGNPTPRVTRAYDGAVGSQADVRDSDRLRDERTGQVYVITSVSRPTAPGITPDTVLELRRAT